MDLDFEPLTAAIIVAARAAFTEARETWPDENYFAYALSTIDDATYVGASANSHENHAAIAEANDVEEGTPDDEYYQWSPCEWGELEYLGADGFEPVDALLQELYEATPDEGHATFAEGVRRSMQDALAALDAEGFFGKGRARAKVTLFCTVYDSERAEEYEDATAEALNTRAVYTRFRRRYAATEAAGEAERIAQEQRRAAVADLDPVAQAESFLGDLRALVSDPPDDPIAELEAEKAILENLEDLGAQAALPMLAFVEEHLDAEEPSVQSACASILGGLARIEEATPEVHQALVRLLREACRRNEGREKWRIAPVHIAKALSALFEGYPTASMTSGNKLYLPERFLERAKKLMAL
jgi:hypothetical protein